MRTKAPECNSYIIDTYKQVGTGKYLPGAITFKGRKKIETLTWKKSFTSQQEADAFVRDHFRDLGLKEALNEGEISRITPNWHPMGMKW